MSYIRVLLFICCGIIGYFHKELGLSLTIILPITLAVVYVWLEAKADKKRDKERNERVARLSRQQHTLLKKK